MTLKKAIRKIKHLFFRIQDAWTMLTCGRYALCTSKNKYTTREAFVKGVIDDTAEWLLANDYISKARYDMITTALCDPNVLMVSKNDNGEYFATYECQTDDDFNDLKELKIE